MKRRKFINNLSKLSAAPLLLNGLPLHSFISPSLLPPNCQGISDRVMVIIFMKGGNDGLNTIVPIDQFSRYANLRPDIRLNQGNLINLDTTLDIADQVGLHPSMTPFKAMYDVGQASLIQAVGYPNPNQSHFKSTDLWLSGGDGTPANFNLGSGWMGRYMASAFPDLLDGPSQRFPDPIGIQLGDTKPSVGYHGYSNDYLGVNISNQNPGSLFGLLNGLGTAPHLSTPTSDHGDNLDYIMGVENTTNAYGGRISDVYNNSNNSNTVYPSSYLARQLQTVARLIAGGSTTKLFLVHKNGFDTHADQVQGGNTQIGNHADLLGDVFGSIKAFTEDLANLGLEEKVLTATFSEFGRRISQNGSLGTDHGNFAPLFLFGSAAAAGVKGTNINIDPGTLDAAGNLPVSALQHDYRSIYKTLLQDWLGAGDDVLNAANFGNYNKVPDLITTTATVPPDCYNVASALPVVFSGFTAEYFASRKEALILWRTESEFNHDHYRVQRSNDGRNFDTIETVSSAGESTTSQQYRIIDPAPLAGVSYYRIESVDLDGSLEYTDTRSITVDTAGSQHVKLYPNPAIYDVNVVLTTEEGYAARITIFDTQGKRVKEQSVRVNKGFNKFNLSVTDLSKGAYVLNIQRNEIEIGSMPLIVNR